LFQVHNCCSCSVVTIYVTYNFISHVERFVLHISSFRSMSAVPNMAVFCSSLISCFPDMLLRYCLKYFQVVQLLAVIPDGYRFCFYIPSALYFYVFYILESSWLVSRSHFCLLTLQHVSTCIFLFHYYRLLCPVYCYE